jgi:hypothetical protein
MKDKHKKFAQIVEDIRNLFVNYSANDVASSLFISSLWLPNNGSTIKHLLWTTIFATCEPEKFSKKNKLTSYSAFKKFCLQLYKLTPSFPTLEDYIPNYDWGTVKFHHNKTNYKIFYGTEISHIYDFLMAFQLLYDSFDKEYLLLSNRSPDSELRQCLSIQNRIITHIDSQPSEDKLNRLSLGHIEVAQRKFWSQAIRVFDTLSNTDISDLFGKEDYVVELGAVNKDVLDENEFGNRAFEGSLIPFYFVKHKDKCFSILPRRYSGILIDKWSNLFSKHGTLIKKDKFSYQEELTFQVAKFLQNRFQKGRFYPIVSAIKNDGKPHEILFSGYILSEDKLVLIYVADPYNTKEAIQEQLTNLTPKLKEAVALISKEPITLGLHIERKNVVYESTVPEKKLKIELFVILPQATNKLIPITAPKDFTWDIVFMEQFLGVMDEIEEHEELSEFIDYLREIEKKVHIPITTLLDKYGSFKDSSGVLVPGANDPTMIMIDLQWGTNYRYKSLKSFWEIYPEVDFFDHPRSWKIKQETPTRVRLSAKSYLGCAIQLKIQETNIFITSPLELQKYEQGSLSNLLMECLEDYLSRLVEPIKSHAFFQSWNELEIIIFPDYLLEGERFNHIKHLNPQNNVWKSDTGFPKPSCPGIRLVYNFNKIRDLFKDSTTNDIEIDLLIEIVRGLDKHTPDSNLSKLIAELVKHKGKKPRFKTLYMAKGVSFPEFVKPEIPTIHDHKLSRKTEAEIALKFGIKPGKYKLAKAKEIMNTLRREMVKEIDREISKYAYGENIKYLITRIDALINKFVIEKMSIEESLKHEVDFIREEHYSEAYEEYISQYKDYRYLLEKFVEIKPSGEKLLDSRSFRYLVALSDKISELYSASDNLNYEIYPVGLTIDRDYLFKVHYKDDLDSMQAEYNQDQAKIDLGLMGNKLDRVEFSVEKLLDDLDKAFKTDFGFGIRNLVNILQVMSVWPGYNKKSKEAPYYSATGKEIEAVASKAIKGFDKKETWPILDFLTLKTEDMLTVIGSTKPAEDLPVWEHQKRPYRYTIRPLIFENGKYYWGPYSVERSGRVWVNITTNGILPVDLPAPNVKKVLSSNRSAIEKNLEEKALKIVKRYTQYAERVNYGRGTHDQSIGEYDVLAYFPSKNILLNIECKDIIGAYCLKDVKRIRDRIFRLEVEKGRKVKNPGNLIKVEKREDWLRKHSSIFASVLKWPIKAKPKIISIFVTRMDYWWTKFPPRKTSVKFLRIDFLDSFIASIS